MQNKYLVNVYRDSAHKEFIESFFVFARTMAEAKRKSWRWFYFCTYKRTDALRWSNFVQPPQRQDIPEEINYV